MLNATAGKKPSGAIRRAAGPVGRRLVVSAAALAAAGLVAAVLPPAARADDRSLLEPTQKDPYVFIILDTSGSMHEEVACTATDIANGFCSQECDSGDCLPRMMGDDPDSKIYVAKQSIYTIMASHPNINFGFGHFDQTALAVSWKYWWYALDSSTAGYSLTGVTPATVYPAAGEQHLFGDQAWTCTSGSPSPYNNVGCTATQPAHLDNAWEYERARRYPKLGDTNNAAAYSYFIQPHTAATNSTTNPVYKVTFTPITAGNTMGNASMTVTVAMAKCTNSSCSSSTALTGSPKTMKFDLANQTVYWETEGNLNGTNVPDASGAGGDFYASREINQTYTDPGSMTLESDSDATTDAWSTSSSCTSAGTCNMEQANTNTGDSRGTLFQIGDIIPLDWTTNQQSTIMQRMAPNTMASGGTCLSNTTTPDFGIADYMADHPLTGESALRLKCTQERPIAPDGGTPTGHVMMAFGSWINDGSTTATFTTNANSSSWITKASGSSGDPFFACKPAYVLLLTDGLASSDDGAWNQSGLNTTLCPSLTSFVSKTGTTPAGFACCAADALRTITYGSPAKSYPVRTYVIGLGLTSTSLSGYTNTLQCIADEGGTGNRHFFQGNAATDSGSGVPSGYPKQDPPETGFCSSSNPCDGPGPLLPQNKQDILNALLNILNLIQSQSTSFASAAVPSLQSNIANESIVTSFLPINQPIWPGRVDAFVNPVPTVATSVTLPNGTVTTEQLPDPTKACSSSVTEACHLWNAGGGADVTTPSTVDPDVLLAQGIAGLDTAGTDATKRRVFYAPQSPISGVNRLNFAMPVLTNTTQLYDLETGMGLCGASYTFYPPSSESCTETSGPATTLCAASPTYASQTPGYCPPGQTTSAPGISANAAQTVTWAESIKSYLNPTNNDKIEYLLGDVFHSNPQVLGGPVNPVFFNSNVNATTSNTNNCSTACPISGLVSSSVCGGHDCGFQAYATQHAFRRKMVFFGSNDGEFHALDGGTVGQGTVNGQPAWVYNTGTGNELFAFVPRTVMPTMTALAAAANGNPAGGSETFMVDGPPALTDGFFDPTGGTTPSWHSVVVGSLREGGRAYFALDVTQPDTLTSENSVPGNTSSPTVLIPNPTASNFLPNCINGGSGCGQLNFPTPLWEFTDTCKAVSTCTSNCAMQPCDEDSSGVGKGQPDLGQAWSTPVTGRVRICNDSSCATGFHDQWVVVFGGGMDPSNLNSQGNYLYMLDMATGAVIYKRQLNGSAPSSPAGVDTGLDGYIDTLYIGTTNGFLYKVDLSQPAAIVAQTGLGNRVATSQWQPFAIFNTEGRQMYFPPSVFFDANRNQFGLAWGTGNRQDLWKSDTTTGRFFVLIDNNFTSATSGLPFTATNLTKLTPDGVNSSGNLLDTALTGNLQNGWYLDLNAGERVLNQAFVLAGALIFSSYEPSAATGGTNNTVCIDSGDSRVFVLDIDTGNALSPAAGAVGTAGTPGFVPPNPGLASQSTGGTPPNQTGQSHPSDRYMLLGQTLALNITTQQNPELFPTAGNQSPSGTPGGGPGCTGAGCLTCPGDPGCPCTGSNCQMCDLTAPYVIATLYNMKKHFPSNCRFSNATIAINIYNTFSQATCAAPVPVCMVEKNWKEF